VFAVRLALDRVREQLQANTLQSGRPEIDSSDALMAQMRALEPAGAPALQPAALPMIRQVLDENEEQSVATPWREVSVAVGEDERPRSPDPSAPSGAIWPPVEGRVILHEAASSRMTTHRLRRGGWVAGLGNGWRIFSGEATVYSDLEAGREMLIRLARLHAACAGMLSVNRCIVLATTGQGTWRLWQIVKAERSLRETLGDLETCTTEAAAARIVEAAGLLCDIGARMQHAPCSLPCNIDTVGCGERGAIYVGLMPMEPTTSATPDIARSIGTELGSIVGNALHERRADVLAAIVRNARTVANGSQSARLLEAVLGQVASM
jgi:hypothetical protein